MALGDNFSFHPVGDDSGGGQPTAPQPAPTPPVSPQTGFPSSAPIAGPSSPVNNPRTNTYKGTQFDQSGVGRYLKNKNGLQFNTPAALNSARTIADAYQSAQYHRQAGFGAAIRTTLGLGNPSHPGDYIRARQNPVTGLNPQPGVARPSGGGTHLETEAADW